MKSFMSRPILIATRNVGKTREFRRLLQEIPAEFVGLDDLYKIEAPVEDGLTFLENAVIKARYYSDCFGEIVLADDSGLVVDALDGEPGVHSARYGGEGLSDGSRTRLLLNNMLKVPQEDRTARFECAVVLRALETEVEILRRAVGTVEGMIAYEPRGKNGFGYDSIFVPLGQTLTTAEMSADAKDALSHRGRAIRAIVPVLKNLLSAIS